MVDLRMENMVFWGLVIILKCLIFGMFVVGI